MHLLFSAAKEYTYAVQEMTIARNYYFDDGSAEWVLDGSNENITNTTWDVSGDWGVNLGKYYYYGEEYRMKITDVNADTIHVVVYNLSANEIFFDEDVILSSEGAYFDVEVSYLSLAVTGTITLEMYIEPDGVGDGLGEGHCLASFPWIRY